MPKTTERTLVEGRQGDKLWDGFVAGAERRVVLSQALSIGSTLKRTDLCRMAKSVDDSLCDNGVVEELEPSFVAHLRSDNGDAFLITSFEQVNQSHGLFMGIVSKSEVIENENGCLVELTQEG